MLFYFYYPRFKSLDVFLAFSSKDFFDTFTLCFSFGFDLDFIMIVININAKINNKKAKDNKRKKLIL